jgi:hypothetical protein
VGFRKQVDGRLDQYKEVAKAKLASKKIRVFLAAAKGYKEVEE